MGMTGIEEPQVRHTVERAQADGQLGIDELAGLVAELDLSEEDAEQLRAELEELGVEIVSVREVATSGTETADDAADAEVLERWSAPTTVDSLDLYLAQIGRTPLLTKHEEQT